MGVPLGAEADDVSGEAFRRRHGIPARSAVARFVRFPDADEADRCGDLDLWLLPSSKACT